MKVLCKKILNPITKKDRGESSSRLKTEKEYLVLAIDYIEDDGFGIYIQTEDRNQLGFFHIDGFEFIDQKIPSCWTTVFGEFHEKKTMALLPKEWNYEKFFEDLENEDDTAIELFNIEAEKIYKEVG